MKHGKILAATAAVCFGIGFIVGMMPDVDAEIILDPIDFPKESRPIPIDDPLAMCQPEARPIAEAIRQVSAAHSGYRCDIANQIVKSSMRYGVDPYLVVAVGQTESSWRLNVRGSKGEWGPMQVMPRTARAMGVSNLQDWRQTTDAGVAYLAEMLDRANGDVELALAYYNAGPSRSRSYVMSVARPYIRKVMRTYNQIK